MFFWRTMKRTILMHPASFGPRLEEEVYKALVQSVQGVLDRQFGFVIFIVHMLPLDPGMVQEGGYAKYDVEYEAVMFKPFRHEVLEGVVCAVDSLGVKVRIGPMDAFVYKDMMPSELNYDETSGRWTDPAATTSMIEMGSRLRLKLTGYKNDNTEIFGVGTIRELGLGPV